MIDSVGMPGDLGFCVPRQPGRPQSIHATSSEPKKTFADYVRGLLSDVPKKNSWDLAYYLGYRTPRPPEHLLDGAKWDVDELRDFIPGYLADHIGSADAALIVDDTQVLKKGDKSVRVAPSTTR